MAIDISQIINNAEYAINNFPTYDVNYYCVYNYEIADKRIGNIFKKFHSFLNYCFEKINIRSRKESRNYLANDSRLLINTINAINDFVDNLTFSGYICTIEDTYIKNMGYCLSFLKESYGSIIPDDFKVIKIIKAKPIFFIATTFGNVKNIIFGSSLKPDIIITDALENNIEIANDDGSFFIYDKNIINGTITMKDLRQWWENEKVKKGMNNINYATGVQNCLQRIEVAFFRTYCKEFNKDNDPAIFPQVYLHYDPKTIKELTIIENGKKRLAFQRMDFLILYRNKRIVIEIDGKEHYSENGQPSPEKYAAQVAYDRKMKFLGYDIFRIGGYELSKNANKVKDEFFKDLIDYLKC